MIANIRKQSCQGGIVRIVIRIFVMMPDVKTRLIAMALQNPGDGP